MFATEVINKDPSFNQQSVVTIMLYYMPCFMILSAARRTLFFVCSIVKKFGTSFVNCALPCCSYEPSDQYKVI